MSGGSCTVCPNRCRWSDHSNVPYHIKYNYDETVTKYVAKKEIYEEHESGKQRVERLLVEKQKQLDTLQIEV